MEREYEKVKLHVTLMNTSFKRFKRDYQARFKERYDASEILKVTGLIFINSIHLSFIINS